eukprot:scaffold1800_cov387-Prasinococcus_capsulatus_cf.AAC.17
MLSLASARAAPVVAPCASGCRGAMAGRTLGAKPIPLRAIRLCSRRRAPRPQWRRAPAPRAQSNEISVEEVVDGAVKVPTWAASGPFNRGARLSVAGALR